MRQPSKAPDGRPLPPKVAAPSALGDEEEPQETLRERFRREMVWFDKFLKLWLARGIMISIHLTVIMLAFYAAVWGLTRGMSYDRAADVPPRICALVLGTQPKVGGHDNQFFTARINAAADLFKEGKMQYLIVSGDNSRNGYDEPSEMKAALIARGVPATRIYCDYAGFRTLDSVVRAQRIFGQREFIIISQKYHNERALYIAQRHGMQDCVAYNAADASTDKMVFQYARELVARVMAVLDVEFFKTEPKKLGNKISIGERTPPVDANPVPKR